VNVLYAVNLINIHVSLFAIAGHASSFNWTSSCTWHAIGTWITCWGRKLLQGGFIHLVGYDLQFLFVCFLSLQSYCSRVALIWLMATFIKAFQVLSEYLQLLDSFSELSAIQEMSRGVEVCINIAIRKHLTNEWLLPTICVPHPPK